VKSRSAIARSPEESVQGVGSGGTCLKSELLGGEGRRIMSSRLAWAKVPRPYFKNTKRPDAGDSGLYS
jgi:hypothetical protein